MPGNRGVPEYYNPALLLTTYWRDAGADLSAHCIPEPESDQKFLIKPQ